jgi:hypothetical protein
MTADYACGDIKQTTYRFNGQHWKIGALAPMA